MKRYITSIVLAFALCAAASAAITGAVTCTAGELAIINCDSSAVWSVYPADYMASYAVSDDGKTVYFASPKKGAVTFFAASVTSDGLPTIDRYTLYNGVDVDDDVTPEPAPQPAPEPEPETVSTIVKNADVDATAEEFDALAAAFETAVSGIDRGTIRTPAGARETFRAVWIRQAATVNPDAIATFSALLATLGEKVDNSTLATVKADYTAIIDALKERSEKTKKTAKEEDAKTGQPEPAKPTTSSCPNGQCPANGTRFYRWGY